MEVTVRINSATATGKRLLKELKKYPKTVEFDNPAISGIIPEGYMSADEFKERANDKVKTFCKNNGIL